MDPEQRVGSGCIWRMLKIELDTGFSKAFTGWWCLSGRDWLSGLGAEEVYEVV